MKLTFQKLGYIDYGEIIPGNLTIIAGNNNVGKTYINYTIYCLLNNISRIRSIDIDKKYLNEIIELGFTKIDLQDYLKNFNDILKKYSKEFSKNIASYFSANEDDFLNTEVELEFEDCKIDFAEEFNSYTIIGKKDKVIAKKAENSSIVEFYLDRESNKQIPSEFLKDIFSRSISRIIFKKIIKRPFIVTSERTGISLFYKELDFAKNKMVEFLSKEKTPNPSELFDIYKANYADPIKDNIDIIRGSEGIQKNKSFLLKDRKDDYLKISKKISSIIGGSFKVAKENKSQIYFETRKEKNRNQSVIPIHLASSATKSFYILDLYLKSIAQPNDILMIDEPELNLHPSNQIEIAKLLANLVNLGIDVIITTHSDYIIKELNNLIMLSNSFDKKQEIMSNYKYDENDILSPEKVKVYIIENHRIKEAKTDQYGIDSKLFDDTILEISQRSNEIYYSLDN